MATIEEMSQDVEAWGFRKNTPLTFIEKRFIPTLKMSSVNYEYSLHLIIPKNDQVFIYDQNGESQDIKVLKPDQKINLLLLLDGIEFKNNYFSVKFLVEQIRVKLSPNEKNNIVKDEPKEIPTGECILEESLDEKSNANINAPKYSHNPKEELYSNLDEPYYEDEEENPLVEQNVTQTGGRNQVYDDEESEDLLAHSEDNDLEDEDLEDDEEEDDEQFSEEEFPEEEFPEEDDEGEDMDGVTLNMSLVPEEVLDQALIEEQKLLNYEEEQRRARQQAELDFEYDYDKLLHSRQKSRQRESRNHTF